MLSYIKYLVALVCYHIGDLLSRVMMWHEKLAWVYGLYNFFMLLSSKLDDKDRIWKQVDDVRS